VSDPTNSQEAVIAFLRDPASHGGAGPVEVITTHASMIFLAGDRAWKLKRAVTYSFLDYGSVDRRETACRAELALNRRTAPQLYLGVRAIRRHADGSLGWDGSGEALDWVVEMARFPQEALFSHLVAVGGLTPALMRGSADAIAAFHQAAEITRDFGGSDGIADVLRINAENMREVLPPTVPAAEVERLIARTAAMFDRHHGLLEARRVAGKVRRCHGDLHLGNLCLLDGQPTLFDGIEFNDALACTDVLYDLAFLLMDLLHRGQGALASVVFNRYLDRAEEGDGLALMPLFLSLRAGVRAHVTARAARPQPAPEAAAYFRQAEALLRPVPPRLLAIGGLSGSGKSTLAAALAPAIGQAPGARLLRSDVLRKRHFGCAPEEKLPPEAYAAHINDIVYERLLAETRVVLTAGYSVILDAVAARPGERDAFAALARAAGVPFAGLWLQADPARLAARLAARRNDASDADENVLRQQLDYDLGPLDWYRIDADGVPAAVAATARQVLGMPR
jgi:aminoglycoside phosphotransferase family enzyme/predicted kinase